MRRKTVDFNGPRNGETAGMHGKVIDLPRLYLITDRRRTGGRPLLQVLEAALEGGVRMIQLREKDLSGRELLDLAAALRRLTHRYGAKLLINDRIDIALAVDADGVHLPADSFAPGEALALLGEGKIVGVSTHAAAEAEIAAGQGATFITFGPVYFTPSKAPFGEPRGTGELEDVCRKVNVPVYALGGVDAGKAAEVTAAGAFGAAMISAILSARDVKGEAERIGDALALTAN